MGKCSTQHAAFRVPFVAARLTFLPAWVSSPLAANLIGRFMPLTNSPPPSHRKQLSSTWLLACIINRKKSRTSARNREFNRLKITHIKPGQLHRGTKLARARAHKGAAPAIQSSSPPARHRRPARTEETSERHGGVGRVRGGLRGGAGVAEQGRQRVAADGGDAGGHPVHAGAGGAVRQHREEEVGGELGLHGALRLRVVAAGVGAGGVPHGVRGAAAALLGQGRGGAVAELPGPARLALGHGARGHAPHRAVLPGGHAGAVPVRVRRHHAGAPGGLRAGPHEHQGLDGLHTALAHLLLHRRRLQPLGRRLPLPLGRHRLLRRIRHPPLLRRRRLHRRLLGGPAAEERPGALLPEQHPADDRRRRAAVDGLGRVQRRRAVRRQHRGVRGRAQHQRLRRHQPPHLDLPRRHLLQQAVRHRRRAGHDDRARLHHPRSRAGADMGGGDHGRVRGQRAVVHDDDPAQEVGAADAGGRHAGGVPHARRGGPAGRRAHGPAGDAGAAADRVPGAGPPRRILRRRRAAGRQAAGGGRVRGGVERRRHVTHPARHRPGGAAADARRPAHDRRRRRARRGGLRALGRRGEVRRHAARRGQGRRRHGEGELGGAPPLGDGGQGRHHPAVDRAAGHSV